MNQQTHLQFHYIQVLLSYMVALKFRTLQVILVGPYFRQVSDQGIVILYDSHLIE